MIQVQERLLTVDDVWELSQLPEYEHTFLELIDGKLITMPRPKRIHGLLSNEIGTYLRLFNMSRYYGEVTQDSGHHPPNYRYTLLGPDVAFTRAERLPALSPDDYTPVMPDLAVEVLSPSESLIQARDKALVYLRNGTLIVWLVQPERRGVDVCRLVDGSQLQIEFISGYETLSGEDILPGFELAVDKIFAVIAR